MPRVSIGAKGGGVNWSKLQPNMGAYLVHDSAYTTVVTVSGAGYLTGITVDGESGSKNIRITIDGTVMYSGAIHDASIVDTFTMGISFLHRFDSSLLVEVQTAGNSDYCLCLVSYVLE